ncbi:MAG: hypothetical protein RL431_1086, partial [Actinomycetota bacterium]
SSPTAWRTVDYIVTSVIAVLGGALFVLWGQAYVPLSAGLMLVLPGSEALLDGGWLFPGILVAMIVRKPGAAFAGEMIASVVSVAIGNAWGGAALLLGFAQGLALEAGFAVRRYRSFGGVTIVVAGLLGGITQGVLEVLNWYAGATAAFTGVYVASAAVSGVVLAGGFSVIVLRSVKSTGVLRQFGHV